MNCKKTKLILLVASLSISACTPQPVSQCPKAPSLPPVGEDMLERMNYLISPQSVKNTDVKESR